MRLTREISTDQSRPFADRVQEAKRILQEELSRTGMSRIAGEMAEIAEVSIRLTVPEDPGDEIAPGCSKLGGTPDLPEGLEWPRCNNVPMALLAQVRLQDIAPYDVGDLLPKSGVLYFFYEAEAQVWGFDPKDRGNWKVIHYDGDRSSLRPAKAPEDLPENSRFAERRVVFVAELALPRWNSSAFDALMPTDAESNVFLEMAESGREEDAPLHRLFGDPDQIQNDMPLECQLASHGLYVGDDVGYDDPRRAALEAGAADWRLLLQIDSDEDLGTCWGDVGRVYFWIQRDDLRRHDFNNVWLILQCY